MQLFKSQWLQESRRPCTDPVRGYGARYGLRHRALRPDPPEVTSVGDTGAAGWPAVELDWPAERFDRAA